MLNYESETRTKLYQRQDKKGHDVAHQLRRKCAWTADEFGLCVGVGGCCKRVRHKVQN